MNTHSVRRMSVPVVVAIALALPSAMAQENKTAAPAGAEYWKGLVMLPATPLELLVVFRPAPGGGFVAKLDIPVQGVKDTDLIDVKYTVTEIAFTLGPPANAVFTATRAAGGATAEGELNQSGMKFPLRLEKITAEQAQSVGPRRPQTPKPPFPYATRDVTYENAGDGTRLAGTLTIPEGKGPHPAVLLITGSGAQDRDETIFGHKPFLVLADCLTRRGVAVLRLDDRGVGGTTGNPANATADDLAADVLAGVAFLKKQPEIDPQRIGLMGHSEGATLAPLAASRSADVHFIVLLAGTSLPGREILAMQLKRIAKLGGATDENVERQLVAQKRLMDLIERGAETAEVRAALRELSLIQQPSLDHAPPDASGKLPLDTLLDQQTAGLTAAWFRSFLKYDPRKPLRQVKCPVLALGGTLDTQVPVDENLPGIEQAVRDGGNTKVTARKLEGLNHLFQEAKSGHPGEYVAIEQTFSPQALEIISKWIREQTGLEK